jgi:hypothetical protein
MNLESWSMDAFIAASLSKRNRGRSIPRRGTSFGQGFGVWTVVNGTGMNSLSSLPVFGSLSRTTPSNPAEASCLPSGLNATA